MDHITTTNKYQTLDYKKKKKKEKKQGATPKKTELDTHSESIEKSKSINPLYPDLYIQTFCKKGGGEKTED